MSEGWVPDADLDVPPYAVACRVPGPDDEQVAAVLQPRRVPVRLLEEPEPVLARARDLPVECGLGGMVLLRPGRVVLPGCDGDLMGGDEDGAAKHDQSARTLEQQEPEPVRVVRGGEQGDLLEPPDEGLRVPDTRPDVDDAGQARLVEPPSGRRQLRDAGDSPAPRRRRRRVEADVVDHRRRRVGVGLELAAGAKRVQQHLPAVAGEVELGQVDVPGALRRPADELPGAYAVAARDARIDVPVAEVADADAAAGAGRGRGVDDAALDRKDAVRAIGGSAPRGAGVADRPIDAPVVDRAEGR